LSLYSSWCTYGLVNQCRPPVVMMAKVSTDTVTAATCNQSTAVSTDAQSKSHNPLLLQQRVHPHVGRLGLVGQVHGAHPGSISAVIPCCTAAVRGVPHVGLGQPGWRLCTTLHRVQATICDSSQLPAG
jgi:hypothetical protein